MPSALFSPIKLADLALDNRIVVSPMCQYSAEDGLGGDWHIQHLGARAMGGAGIVFTEATHVSAIGRITAGVAHEVKNPLNSMRLWLENLKENLPAGDGVPRQAVAVLDSEIDRLDSVVKRFLDFMRPQELRLEETHLDELLDDHASEFEECRRWASSDAGQLARAQNPAGFANVRAHAEAHLRAIALGNAAVSNKPAGNR